MTLVHNNNDIEKYIRNKQKTPRDHSNAKVLQALSLVPKPLEPLKL